MPASASINRPMSPGDWALLVSLSLLWGGSFFFNGVTVVELPTLTVVFCRVALAALVLLAVLRLTGRGLPGSGEVWRAFFGMGLLNNAIPFSLIVWGQTEIASGLASILNATTPLFTVLVAHLLTSDEKLSAGRLFGVLAGFFGVAIMIGLEALSSLGLSVLAQLAVLGAALSYAFAGVYGRRFKALGVSPIQTATGQVVASSLLLLAPTLLLDRPWTLAAPSAGALAALAGLALLSTALAYILYFRLLASAGATNLLLVTFLVPVSAILLGAAFLGESLEPQHLIGMAAIALGLAAIDGRPLRLLRLRPAPRP